MIGARALVLPSVTQPTRAAAPYLLKPAGPIEGLCRYFTTLPVDDERSFGGRPSPIVMRRGESYVAVSVNDESGFAEPVVAESADINATRGLLTAVSGYRTLKWRIGRYQLEAYGIASQAELLAVARSVRISFDENGTHFTSVEPGDFRPDGSLGVNQYAYGTIVYDDCRRTNRPSTKSPPVRTITLATGPKLTGVEIDFAVAFGKTAVPEPPSVVTVERYGKSLRVRQRAATDRGQTTRFLTWVERGAQVSIVSTGFSEDFVLDFIRKLTTASLADYRKMRTS